VVAEPATAFLLLGAFLFEADASVVDLLSFFFIVSSFQAASWVVLRMIATLSLIVNFSLYHVSMYVVVGDQ